MLKLAPFAEVRAPPPAPKLNFVTLESELLPWIRWKTLCVARVQNVTWQYERIYYGKNHLANYTCMNSPVL